MTSLALCVLAGAVRAQGVPDHGAFSAVLTQVVHGDLVDYRALLALRGALTEYLSELGRTGPVELERADRNARLAFWVNAYNACTLELVSRHYPIQPAGGARGLANRVAGVPANSIRQIPNTWDDRFCVVAGAPRSLDEIEHRVLRPMGDPRIHAAINCASRSCPSVRAWAYRADSLELQLDDQMRRLAADPRQVRLDRDANVLTVNPLFDWFAADFGRESGVRDFLARYLPPDAAALVRSRTPRLAYFEYDWTLNDTAVFGRATSRP